MRFYTVDELMAYAPPCEGWTRERVQALYDEAGIEHATAIDVLECAALSDSDSVWQASRMMTPDQRSVAAWAMASETELSAFAAASAANAAASAHAAAAAAAWAASVHAAVTAVAAPAVCAASWRLAREVWWTVCQEVE